MQPENSGGPRVIQRPFLDHQLGAALFSGWRAFFGRLENEFHRAVNLVAHVAQHFGDPKRDRHVRVVPAGMMHTGVLRLVGHVDGGRHRKSVHVGAPGDHRARRRALQQRYDAVLADAGSHVVQAKRPQLFRHHTGRTLLAIRQFGMPMEIAALLDESGLQSVGGPRNALLACLSETSGGQQRADRAH